MLDMKSFGKRCVQVVFLCLVAPAALLAGFGRLRLGFEFFAQAFALVPGMVGDFLRVAYYKLTLTACSLDSRIQFGSFFAHPQATVGQHVYIGAYCVLGQVEIGDRTQIASAVQVLSGSHQHARDSSGKIWDSGYRSFARVTIGADCWVGAGSIVMAAIGERSTIGAGSVVVHAIPPRCVAVGAPARVVTSVDEVGAQGTSGGANVAARDRPVDGGTGH